MPLKRHVAQLTQAFDRFLWADLCEALAQVDLTPQELVESLRGGALDSAEAWMEEEIERRVAERLQAVAIPPPPPTPAKRRRVSRPVT